MLFVKCCGVCPEGVWYAPGVDEVGGDSMSRVAKSGGDGFAQYPRGDVAWGSGGFRIGISQLGLGVREAGIGVRRDVNVTLLGPGGGEECGVNVINEVGNGFVRLRRLGGFLGVRKGL